MVTITKIGEEYNSQILEISGLSTDPKPVDHIDGVSIANGSTFKEIDTGKEYTYNESAETWHINKSASSGGGSGVDGEDGATFTPAVSADGTLSWSNDKGLENPAPVNIKGPQGEQGPKGDTGATGPAGADGAKGEKGDRGEQGLQGIPGEKGDTGAPGADGAKGDKGDKGDTGPAGANGAQGPKGDQGEPGKDGADGAAGKDGTDGKDGEDGGYYTPGVTQPTTDTMQISFAPSKPDMPAVNTVTVNLPVSENSGQNVNWMYVTVEIEDEIPCTGIMLNKSALNFTGAGQQTIVATVTPANTTDTLVWTSSKPAVAAVANGVVTAYANGSATITATCGEYSASCTVEVSGISSTVAVTGIMLDKTTASVQVGSTITLTATVKPDNATNKTVTWTSDNEPVATVEGGVVTGISEGTASIGAMTADGGFSAVCNVTVAAASHYRNLFDKDTMVTADEGINGSGGISSSYKWGLARVPVKENTVYSIKTVTSNMVTGGTQAAQWYNCATAGAFGFADVTGDTLLSHLSFATSQDAVDSGTIGANALLSNYLTDDGDGGWVTFTTPADCAYLLFNTTLKNNADKIQLEEGDTIHNYYLPYNGGAE